MTYSWSNLKYHERLQPQIQFKLSAIVTKRVASDPLRRLFHSFNAYERFGNYKLCEWYFDLLVCLFLAIVGFHILSLIFDEVKQPMALDDARTQSKIVEVYSFAQMYTLCLLSLCFVPSLFSIRCCHLTNVTTVSEIGIIIIAN